MAVLARDDGLFDVTDQSGAVVVSGIPADFAPPMPAPAPPPPEPLAVYSDAAPPPTVPLEHQPQPTAGIDPAQFMGGNKADDDKVLRDYLGIGPAGGPAHTGAPQGGAASAAELAPGPSSPPAGAPAAAPLPGFSAEPTTVDMAQKFLLEQRPAGPVRKIPERDVLQSFGVQKGAPPISEQAQADIDAALGRSAKVAQQGGEALGLVAQQSALLSEKRAQDAKTEIASMRTAETQRQEQLANRMSMLTSRIDEARNSTLDPDRYWKRKGTAGTIAAKIGIALGALGGAVTGRPNEVYQQIKDEWEADLLAQKSEIDADRWTADAERSLLGEMRLNFSSQIASDNATRAVMAEASASEAQSMAAQATSIEAQTRGMELAAKFQLDAADYRAKAEQAEADTITESWKHEQAKTVGGGGGRMNMDELLKRGRKLGLNPIQTLELATKGALPGGPMNRAQVEYAKDVRSRQVRLPNGDFAYAATGSAAEETQGVLDSRSGLRRNFSRMREIAKTSGKSMSPALRAEYETYVQSNKMHMKKLEVLGAITEADQRLVSPMVGEKGQEFFKFDSATEATLDAADRHLNHQEKAARARLYSDPDATKPISEGIDAPLPEGTVQKK